MDGFPNGEGNSPQATPYYNQNQFAVQTAITQI